MILMMITGRIIIFTLIRSKYLEGDKNLDTIIYDRLTMCFRHKGILGDCLFWEGRIVSILIISKLCTILGTIYILQLEK